jgi:hypothetical protein
MVLVDKNLAGLDWNDLLQKAEEGVKVLEEEGNFAIPNQTPQTGIEEMVGVSHAYYEKQLEEMGKLLEEAEALMNQKVTPTPPIEVSRTEAAPELPNEDPIHIWHPEPESFGGPDLCADCGKSYEDGNHYDKSEEEVKRLEEEIASLEGEV